MEFFQSIFNKVKNFIKKNYYRVVGSIAFIPSIVATFFVFLAIGLLQFDLSDFSLRLKAIFSFIEYQDPETARTILITLLGGILSLTVFSFSMVMVMLGQALNNSSPKIMDMLIKKKPPQIVLGIYIGTILYTLIISLNIYNIKDQPFVPPLSFLFGNVLGISNIFLFIYFINHIAQSMKPHNIISRIHTSTIDQLEKRRKEQHILPSGKKPEDISDDDTTWHPVMSPVSGYLQDVDAEALVALASKHNSIIRFEVYFGSYLIEGIPLLSFNKEVRLDEEALKIIRSALVIYFGEDIDENYNYGFQQIMEIAIKALSPGINDPGTALICIDTLGECFALRMEVFDKSIHYNNEDKACLITKPVDLNRIMHISLDPLRLYGKKDYRILLRLLTVLYKLGLIEQAKEAEEYQQIFNRHARLILFDADAALDHPAERQLINSMVDKMNKTTNDFFELKTIKD